MDRNRTMEKIRVKQKLYPVIPLRGVTLFPGMTLHFDVMRKFSVAALKHASGSGDEAFFVAQKDISVEHPTEEDFCRIGVVGEIKQILRLPEQTNMLRVVVEGKYRAQADFYAQTDPYFTVAARRVEDSYDLPEGTEETAAFMQEASVFSLRRFFDAYASHVPQLTPAVLGAVLEQKDAGKLADFIAGNIFMDADKKQRVLEELNVFSRAELLCGLLAMETEIISLDEELQSRVEEAMDKNQREYYLREELKIITDELNEIDGEDASGLAGQIEASAMPEECKEKLRAEMNRLKQTPPASPESNVSRAYIEKCLEIPWGVYTKENRDLARAARILDRDHYGLKDVKERVTEMLATFIVSPEIKGQIICLVGPPGVGKTSVAKSIARATNRKYTRIALGGIHDEAEIRGHRKTYIGSMPGRIVSALIDAKSMNPLVLLDEIDKLGKDFRGDPAAAMLEVLDGEQNFSFRDNYIELPLDLSKVLFITTANDKNGIPEALLDRMEIIELPSYTYEEKFHIAKKHLIPKQFKAHGLKRDNLSITDAAVRQIIDGYTREAGVRILERRIAAVCRKEAVRLAGGETEKLTVTPKNLEDLLGPRKYRPDEIQHTDEVGLVNGLAWTAVGGELLQAEVAVLEGTGKLELTGSLGDVMKESARTAISFVRSRANQFNIDKDFYKTKDIHIHFPEGAVPKDGPSAGVTVTTALVSALTDRKVSGKVAMTGEVTLRGRVLPIGGLREKAMAAYREGMSEVLIPAANLPDLQEVDPAVKEKLTFTPVKNVDEVLAKALLS